MTASSEGGTVAMPAVLSHRSSRTSAPVPERFPLGAVLGQRYRIAGRLGRGGMGEVYRAYDLILQQDVALKFLPATQTSSAEVLDRFRNEVRLARQVSHPNVCRVYDIGEIEGEPFLSMEYVDGEDLASLLRRIGRLPADKALDIARRLCAGLAAAHEKGVLHRDLKPANIMIDARGEVLITDFGLAALAGSVGEHAVRQGTPAYQAPEQLAGREVTIKSDLYALGLVLYEMFTGRRAFEANSMDELARMQSEGAPAPVSSIAKDVEPAVDRAIHRCLTPDPRHRPPSAKAVAASLPGGDPLAAAIAAGATPSPAMVAQAGEGEGMRPAFAVGLLAFIVSAVVAVAAIQGATSFPSKTKYENSPEVLQSVARDIVKRLGYTDRPADTASSSALSGYYLQYAPEHYSGDQIGTQLATARPAPIQFWYRQSPEAMNPRNALRVSVENPGFSVPGMVRLRLDMEGRLLRFEALPGEQTPESGIQPDWKALFDAAKLDAARFQPATPQWTPGMAFDAAAAWTGTFAEAPEVPIRVEAAAWRGKPVSFRIVGPWSRPRTPARFDSFAIFWIAVPLCVVVPLGVLLARRNLRLQRGDRQGAMRLGAAVCLSMIASRLIGMHYFWGAGWLKGVMLQIFYSLGWGVLVAVAYLAIEPYIRRRSPGVLVSWTRLLRNGPRDPLAGRDVLAGLAAALLLSLVKVTVEGIAGNRPNGLTRLFGASRCPDSVRWFLGSVLEVANGAVVGAMVLLFLYSLVHLVVRRDWLAAAVVAVVAGALSATFSVPLSIFAYCMLVFPVLRFGLLGMVASIAGFGLWSIPTQWTLDPSRWYFGYSLTSMLLIVALAVWAFRTAMAGRKLLEDENLA